MLLPPPETVAWMPAAELNHPPPMTALDPLAVLPRPPAMVASGASAVFWLPPPMLVEPELARLSKIITEQRAVGVKERDVALKTAKQADSTGGSDKAKPPTTGLPDNFDEIVRRIYGVEVKDEERTCQL